MGLISEWIEVGLGSKNIKYYEDLGYKIPKTRNKWGKLGTPKGKKIKVKVTDLPKGSHAIVKVVCDCCNKNYETFFKFKIILPAHKVIRIYHRLVNTGALS